MSAFAASLQGEIPLLLSGRPYARPVNIERPAEAEEAPRCSDCDAPFVWGASVPWVALCLCEFRNL